MSAEGLRRRGMIGAEGRRSGYTFDDTVSGAPYEAESPYSTQLLAMATKNFAAGIDAAQGVAQKAMGFDDAAAANFREYDRLSGMARQRGPEIQSWDHVEQRGITAGNVGQYLTAQVAGMVPDVGLALGGMAAGTLLAPGVGTVGGLFAGSALRKTAQEAAKTAAESYAQREAARLAAAGVAADVAALSVRASATDVAKRAAAQTIAGDAATKALTGRIRDASMFAGATAAGIPSGLNDDRTVQLAREGDAGDATVLLGGGAAQAVLDTLPILRAVDQIGGQVTGEVLKNTTDRFLARAAKEAAKMGALEGTTELGQEVIKNASHAIVTENPELLYEPDALKNYLVSFFTGAVIGGGVGGGIETGGAAVRQTQRTARQAWEATNNYFRDKIRGPVQKDPGVAQNQAQADEVVAATRTPQDPSVLRGIRERSSYGVDNARKSAEINAQAEAATRSANEWRRSNRDFPLSLEVQRASGHGAEINLTMLSFVDGLPAFAQSLADTRPREQAADFLARTGSALYRSITAPHTLSADDQKMVAAVDPYITPARRTVMQALATDWAARQAEVDAERADREAEAAAVSVQPKAGALGAVDGFEDMAAALRGQALVTQDYEGDTRDDRESPAPQETDADSRFAEMSPEDNVGAVDAYISALRAPTEGLDLESARVSAIAELEGPLKPGNRTPNNVISDAGNSAFFARRSQENGVLPYGEGRVWDAVGHARRLLAQNREVYAKADQPAKAALLDALSQAAAVGMPVDFGALRAGAYRMDRAGQELVRLTEAEVNAVQRSARFARPDSPTVPANPDSVVPFVDLGREQSAGYGYGPSDLAQRVRAAANETPIRLHELPDGAVKRTTPRRDTTLDPPPPPEQDEADYRLGPGPLPAGAEARAVFPANRDPSAPVTPAPPVYDADGNVVEDGWLPASGGGYRSTATGEIITDINRFRAATLDARGTVPDMSPVRSVGFLGNRALTDETPKTTAVKALGATIGADVDPRTGLPKITHPIASRYRYGAEPGTMLAVVRFLRGNEPTSVEADVPETLIGWPARTPERATNPETEAPASARQIAATNRVRADFAPTVPDVVAHDADLTSPDAQAILHRMFNAKDGYAATLGVPIDGLPRDTRSTVDLVDELRGIVANGERPAARTAERFISELRGLADLAGPASVVARVFDTRYVQDAPAVARSASPYTAPDLEALGRRIAQRASDADLAAVKERAAQADVPYAVSRLSNEQADVVQKAAVAFVRPLGIPTLLTQFGGFLRRSGDTTVGATTYSVNGKHFVAIHTANMRKPDAVLDDEISSNRLKRTVTHEMAHVLARMHHDSTGALLSADPELAPGSEVWAQAEASVNANPVLSKTFGHVFNRAKTDAPAAQREMFAQLISLRNTHPRLLNAHIPAAATVLDTLLQVARDAAAGRASTRTSAAIEDAGSGAREADGADGRDVPSGAGNQPQPRAAAGRDRQRSPLLRAARVALRQERDARAAARSGSPETARAYEAAKAKSDAAARALSDFDAETRSLKEQQVGTVLGARYSADPGAARREADAQAAQTTAEQTAEQRTREGAYTEALLRGMGFPPASVTVASHTTEAGVVGAFEGAVTISPEGRITIVLGDALTGAERAEVLQHEIGHVVLLQHIAKEAGVPLGALVGADGRMPTLNEVISALAEVSPELHAALKTDYDQWLSDNVDKAKGVNAVLASRGGLARAVGRQARGDAGPPLRDMDQAEVEALVSMEEWIADGVVRALNANRTATSIAGKFFSELARVLRAMYDRLTGGQQTPPSIERWVNGLFDAEATRLGGTVAEGRRKIIERASTFLHRAEHGLPPDIETEAGVVYERTYSGVVDAWTDVVQFAMTPEQRTIMQRIVFRDDVDERLRTAFAGNRVSPHLKAALDDPQMALETRIAALFALSTGPEGFRLDYGPNVGNVFAKLRSRIATWIGYASDADYAETILDAARDGSLHKIAAGNKEAFTTAYTARAIRRKRKLPREGDPAATYVAFDHKTPTLAKLPQAKRKMTARVERAEALFDRMRTVYNRTVAESVYERAEASGIPTIVGLAAKLYTPGDVGGSDRGMVRAIEHKIALEQQKTIRAAGALSEDGQQAVLDLLQRAVKTDALPDTPAGRAARAIRQQLRDFYTYQKDAGVKLGFQEDFFPVVPDVDGERTETVTYLAFDRVGEDGQRAYKRETAKVTPKQAKLFAVLNQPKFENEMRAFKDALVAQRRDARIAQLEDLMAREKDPAQLNALRAELDKASVSSETTLDSLSGMAFDFVESAIRDPEFAATSDNAPRARGANRRSMDFIYKLGTPEEIATFAEVQSKDLAAVIAAYTEPMVRKAEYTRQLGGGRYERMLSRIEAEGGTAEDVAFARDMVSAALGTYGADGSPVISMVSKSLAQKIHGRATQSAISNVMAYQNWRLLPLALLSSISDPVLIGVRAGGDMRVAFSAIRKGLRASFNKESRAEMEQMIAQLGAAADFGAEANLQHALGGLDQTALSRRANDILFRINGMSWLAKSTRHMALHAAHGFLSRHASRPNDHSERYMRELGLQDGDIQVETVLSAEGRPVQRVSLDTGDTVRDYRVRKALLNFVDDAVLRPNAMQSPLWHADPYVKAVTQYKSFLYAMWDQFGRRIGAEINNGNFVGLLPAVLAYAPVAVLAMLMREEIQYGDAGNPNRADWTLVDYTQTALMNSGMLGPGATFISSVERDISEDRVPVITQLGPAFTQASNIAESAVGARDAGETMQEAVPTSVIWEKRFGTEPQRQQQLETQAAEI